LLALLVAATPLPAAPSEKPKACPKCESSKKADQTDDDAGPLAKDLEAIGRERAAIAQERKATERLAEEVLKALKKAGEPSSGQAEELLSLRKKLAGAEEAREEAVKQAEEEKNHAARAERLLMEMRRDMEIERESMETGRVATERDSAAARGKLAALEEELNAFRNRGKTWEGESAAFLADREALGRKLADSEATANKVRAELVAAMIAREKLEAEIQRLKARPTSLPEIAPVRYSKNIDVAEGENSRVLADVRAVLADFPDARFHLIGHTSSESTASLNLALSIRRAQNLGNYLVSQGIPIDRVTFEGQGEASPIADNNTEECRALNRRVEIWVTD